MERNVTTQTSVLDNGICARIRPSLLKFCIGIWVKTKGRDFPGSPVAETLFPVQEAWVPYLGGELDPTCCS